METTQTGEHFGNLPKIPSPMNYHCISALSSGDIFVAAGRTFGRVYGRDVFLFKRDEGKWHTLNDVPTGRINIACGVARERGGTKEELVLAGGYNGEAVDTVEIYSVENGQWRKGSSASLEHITND